MGVVAASLAMTWPLKCNYEKYVNGDDRFKSVSWSLTLSLLHLSLHLGYLCMCMLHKVLVLTLELLKLSVKVGLDGLRHFALLLLGKQTNDVAGRFLELVEHWRRKVPLLLMTNVKT